MVIEKEPEGVYKIGDNKKLFFGFEILTTAITISVYLSSITTSSGLEMTSSGSSTGVLFEDDESGKKVEKPTETQSDKPLKNYKMEPAWLNLAYATVLHVVSIYAIYLVFTSAKIVTGLSVIFLHYTFGLGITAGAHRLWAHRAYKAKWQLKLLLIFLNTVSMQGHVLAWARDHRVHHKYSDTMADPYSAGRGFFFAHIGWLTVRKHPEVIEKGKGIDMSDLEAEPILQFQKKYYWYLLVLCAVIFPTVLPVYCWNESWWNSFFIGYILRVTVTLNTTFAVNSFAHFFGYKPYDRNIRPVNNAFVSLVAVGEGWHNYHHTFPWDYKTSELGNYGLNFTNAFIDFFAWIGWAYDLKTVSQDVIKKRVQRTGDGSHEIWGWGDKDMTEEDEKAAIITHKAKLK